MYLALFKMIQATRGYLRDALTRSQPLYSCTLTGFFKTSTESQEFKIVEKIKLSREISEMNTKDSSEKSKENLKAK